MNKVSRAVAVEILWNKGNLTWKLDEVQKELYNTFQDSKNKVNVWLCSRRLGKSYGLITIAIEACLKTPNTIVKYVAPNRQAVRTIIRPLIRQITEDCPKELRPEFKTQEHLYRFPNGSEIQIAGTDNGNADSLRGGSANLCIVDEAGFCADLDYIVKSILIPTTLTTGGKIILSSTPPKESTHEFIRFVREAEYKGTLLKKTIYDNPRLTKEMIDDIIKETGGIDSLDFKREYLCMILQDDEVSVVPEMTDELMKDIVISNDKPSHFDAYVAMDPAFRDLTVVLFGYVDFLKQKLIIEDEVVMNGQAMTTEALAKAIKEKELSLWLFKQPYLRVSDNNLILINDLQRLNGISFLPTMKDDADSALSNMRVMLGNKKILINPRCKVLISHLKYATWAKNNKTYDRVDGFGHFDAVDSLKYLCRNIQLNKNPYPNDQYNQNWFVKDRQNNDTSIAATVKKMVNLKK